MTAAKGSIQIQWSTYDLTFSDFTDGSLPRSFVQTSDLRTSATGAQILSGAPYAAKTIWAISANVKAEDAESLLDMFSSFENSRSVGNLPAIAVDDYTFGGRVLKNAVFTTAPTVSKLGALESHYTVTFGITEV